MEASNAGEYICEARNNAGMTSAVAILEIQQFTPVITLRPFGLYTVKPGNRVILQCSATGNPSPSVTWTKLALNYK